MGAGNSRAEIAVEVAPGHPIWVAGTDTGHLPFHIEGIAARFVLVHVALRLLFHRVMTVRTPMGRKMRQNTFDITGSQFGVMLFPDLRRALCEMVRVTKPRGRVLTIVYGAPTQVEFLGFFIGALEAVVPGFAGLPADPPPLEFQVADPLKLREALVEAGLRDVQVEPAAEILEFESGQQMWDWVTNSNPIGAGLVTDLASQQKAEVREALDGLLREQADGNGPVILTNLIHIGIGMK